MNATKRSQGNPKLNNKELNAQKTYAIIQLGVVDDRKEIGKTQGIYRVEHWEEYSATKYQLCFREMQVISG